MTHARTIRMPIRHSVARTFAALARGLVPVAPIIAIVMAAAATGRPAAAQSASRPDPRTLCAAAIARAERDYDLPPHLLGAIAKVESGRFDAATRETFAWPWTVTARGKGRFLPTRAAAMAEIARLQARGVRNIDVGCMQINLAYHGDAFADAAQALAPVRNAAYAARFLRRLRAQWGSWTRAMGNYHSDTPRLSGPYRAKVTRIWFAERRRAARARRQSAAGS
ncbi:MAG: hypothetical protein D6826_01490 [Alphaproteobacteria bacterium]|nr:MAG: hypothetical protein D6826_01490 [Alphaproteobacteria bacterium]